MSVPRPAAPAGGPYRERLRVPALWWVLGAGLVVSVWLAYQHATGPWVSVPVAAAAATAVTAGLVGLGRLRVSAGPDGLRAGRALLPPWAIGPVEALHGAQARLARGPQAGPSTHLVIRGYVDGVVRVGVSDPDDPVDHWVVSTRDPQRLAAAVTAARDSAAGRPARP